MKIKICGITNSIDAMAAVAFGADAVGFIFVPSSARYIPPERAASIIGTLPPTVLSVGVFANEPRGSILRVIRRTGVQALQLHGEEPPDAVLGYGIPVIKAHRISPSFDVASLKQYSVHAHLLDAWVEGFRGGTGTRCDWEVAARACRISRVILSGGLNPENVEEAIHAVGPCAVDVSSGVEKAAGTKDHGKMHAFVESARRAFVSIECNERSNSRE